MIVHCVNNGAMVGAGWEHGGGRQGRRLQRGHERSGLPPVRPPGGGLLFFFNWGEGAPHRRPFRATRIIFFLFTEDVAFCNVVGSWTLNNFFGSGSLSFREKWIRTQILDTNAGYFPDYVPTLPTLQIILDLDTNGSNSWPVPKNGSGSDLK